MHRRRPAPTDAAPRRGPRRTRRSWAGLLLLGPLLLTLGSAPVQAAPSTFTVSNTQDLRDGAAVTLTATGRRPGSTVEVYQCAKGDYPKGYDMSLPRPFDGHSLITREAVCTVDKPLASLDNAGRAVSGVVEKTGDLAVVFYVQLGKVSAKPFDQTDYTTQVPVSHECGPDSPCTLVVVDSFYKVQQAVDVTFAAEAFTSCGPATDATVTGAGPFSMSGTYRAWATGSCATGTPTPLLADYTETGENAGLNGFQSGLTDFALSATGFTPTGGSPVAGTRTAVFTPVATQAAVIAFSGGYTVSDSIASTVGGVPIPELDITLDEVARIFSTGQGATQKRFPDLVKRNPGLQKVQAAQSLGSPTASLVKPDGALSLPDATTLAVTTAWSALPGPPWTHGVTSVFPVSLSETKDGAVSIPLLSNLPALGKQVRSSAYTPEATPANQVFLYLTDSATAAELGLRTARIKNAANAFVAATPESIAAGVAAMTKNPDGTLSPNAASMDPEAYPLPLVQYAVSPQQVFPDADRKARLVDFLTYATTTGQGADLAPGMFPLTAELKTQAAASLPAIGSAAAPVAVAATVAPRSSSPGRTPSSTRPSSTPTRPSSPGTVAAPQAEAPAPADEETPEAAPEPTVVAIPDFRPASATTGERLAPMAGVLALAALLCGAAYGTSGRRLRPAGPSVVGRVAAGRWAAVLARLRRSR